MKLLARLAYLYTQRSYKKALRKWIALGRPKDSWQSSAIEFRTYKIKE